MRRGSHARFSPVERRAAGRHRGVPRRWPTIAEARAEDLLPDVLRLRADGLTPTQSAQALGVPVGVVVYVARTWDQRQRFEAEVASRPEPEAGMVGVPGERREDCLHLAACLGDVARRLPDAPGARCSRACSRYAPTAATKPDPWSRTRPQCEEVGW